MSQSLPEILPVYCVMLPNGAFACQPRTPWLARLLRRLRRVHCVPMICMGSEEEMRSYVKLVARQDKRPASLYRIVKFVPAEVLEG